MICIIPWLCILPWYWLFVSLSLFVCFSRLDDDVETDETFVYPTEEFAQYQATELAGKYSFTWIRVSSSHRIHFYLLSILLALVRCLSYESYHMLSCNHDTAMSSPITPCLWHVYPFSMPSVVWVRAYHHTPVHMLVVRWVSMFNQ